MSPYGGSTTIFDPRQILAFAPRHHVRFGSLADICSAKRHVRFTPDCDRKSRHRLTGRMLLKATLIYRRTGNLRAVQLLLGHTKIESTVRYLGIDVDDALAIAEQVDV
jgi:integrase